MKHRYILFDLDGTLTDPKTGITRAVAYGLEKMGVEGVDPERLTPFIGPPLKESFMEFYGFTEEEAYEAIQLQRVYFRKKGMYENEIYPGILDMLKELTDDGAILCIATSKPTVFAEQIAEYFKMDRFFIHIVGSNLDGTRTLKADVIKEVLDRLNQPDTADVIMVGDRKHDIIGAKSMGLKSVGVEYGYGNYDELDLAGADHIASTVEELRCILL